MRSPYYFSVPVALRRQEKCTPHCTVVAGVKVMFLFSRGGLGGELFAAVHMFVGDT